MPGTMVIDQEKTFATILLMSCGPKTKFGSSEQDVSAQGEKKWLAECAVTYHAEHGMRPVSEVLSITVTSGTDPAASITPGSPVELANLRLGVSTPEQRSNDRGSKIVGGKPWFACTGIRSVNGHRPAKAE